jgi:3-oxoacyl-[acyl-carrier protein] reductase
MHDRPVIFITGASRGIGRHLARHYLGQGLEVIGCSRGAPPEEPAPNYSHFQLDVTSEAAVTKVFRDIRTRFGRLDIVVNNAAVNPALSLTLLTSYEAALQTLTTNVLGPFVVSREAAKLMMRRKWGRIINFSSMAARHEVAGEAIYSASKVAVQSLTRVMAKELHAHGITCNVIAPSAIATGMTAGIPEGALREVLARNAIPDFGTASDVSNVIDWLIKPESNAVTGQVIFLGGA